MSTGCLRKPWNDLCTPISRKVYNQGKIGGVFGMLIVFWFTGIMDSNGLHVIMTEEIKRGLSLLTSTPVRH